MSFKNHIHTLRNLDNFAFNQSKFLVLSFLNDLCVSIEETGCCMQSCGKLLEVSYWLLGSTRRKNLLKLGL